MKIRLLLLSIIFILHLIVSTKSYAQFSLNNITKGLNNWYNKEVKPTIEGKRDLKIDPNRVRVNFGGKDILRVSTEDEGSLYLDFGVATVQTGNLYKDIARAGAVFSGDVAVMTQVAFEQLEQVTKNKLQQAGVSATQEAPPISEKPELTQGKSVIIYNHTQSPISYALNEKFYTLKAKTGIQHFAADSDFYMQFDDDITENAAIARYYLSGSQYSLYLENGVNKIEIVRLAD